MIKHKKVLITGATGTIGRKICENLIDRGFILVLLGRNRDKLDRLIKALKYRDDLARVYGYVLDFTQIERIEYTVDLIYQEHESIDIIINNAGIGIFSPVNDIQIKDVIEIMSVNVNAHIILNKTILNHMLGGLNKSYQFINISSIAAEKGFALGGLYNTSKFAIEGFTEAFWMEVKKHEIKVCNIKPGLVESEFFDNKSAFPNIEYALKPIDVANCIDFVIGQSEFSNISEIILRPIKKEAQTLFHEMIK